MNRYDSHSVLSLPPKRYERKYIIRLMELDAGSAIDWAATFTPRIVKETRPHKPLGQTIGRNIKLCNTRSRTQQVDKQMKEVTKNEPKMERVGYWIERLFDWTKTRNWNNFNFAVRASRLSHVNSIILMYENGQNNTILMFQLLVHRFNQVRKWNGSYYFDQSI